MLKLIQKFDDARRRNRFTSWSLAKRAAAAAALLGAAVGLVVLGRVLLQPEFPEGLSNRIEQWSFWCATTIALVFGYTSFEVLYRDRFGDRIQRQPVPAAGVFMWKVARVYRVHIPLMLIPLTTGGSLLWTGHSIEYITAAAVCAAVLLWGLAASVWSHLLAGRSLLDGGSAFKGYLVQGFGPPETAFLFYSPAMALSAALAVGLFTEMALRTGVEHDIWGPLYTLAAIFSVGSLWCLASARRIFNQFSHQIGPRFRDAEVLPVWREGELPRRYSGQALAHGLPAAIRPLWNRLIVQYRRRFRIAIPLQFLAALALGSYILTTANSLGGVARVSLVAIVIGTCALLPVFRANNGELGQRYDSRALPVEPRHAHAVHWLLAAVEWLPLLLAGLFAAAYAGYGAATLQILLAVVVGFVLANAVAIPIALREAPDVSLASIAVRAGLIVVLGGAAMAMDLGV